MLNTETFSEVLEALLEESTSENALGATQGHYEGVQDALGFTTILVNTPRYHGPRKPQGTRAYHIKIKAQAARVAHVFNPEQAQAFETLKKWNQLFTESFTRQELKRAFRIAVLKAHPDQGGSSESFQEVKKSYQILEGLVKNEP
ncbi:MAG: hypothetical protein K0R29_2882 [Pseudobdellovibrio sp.]|jgi:hypothetical protein|nr:hypothetical protein [Pseudobdellovibrio sp.]